MINSKFETFLIFLAFCQYDIKILITFTMLTLQRHKLNCIDFLKSLPVSKKFSGTYMCGYISSHLNFLYNRRKWIPTNLYRHGVEIEGRIGQDVRVVTGN